ncbi:hypothetical protein [Flavisericum labens]
MPANSWSVWNSGMKLPLSSNEFTKLFVMPPPEAPLKRPMPPLKVNESR